MVDGFWIVQFEGMQGGGGGVVIFFNGRVFGGDSGYTYEGSYELKGEAINAKVAVRNFLPGIPNVLGLQGDFDLMVKGTVKNGIITGSASPADASAVGIALKLTKRSNLQ